MSREFVPTISRRQTRACAPVVFRSNVSRGGYVPRAMFGAVACVTVNNRPTTSPLPAKCRRIVDLLFRPAASPRYYRPTDSSCVLSHARVVLVAVSVHCRCNCEGKRVFFSSFVRLNTVRAMERHVRKKDKKKKKVENDDLPIRFAGKF